MKARIYYGGITYFTKRKYIYCYNGNCCKVMKYELTDAEKESIKNFEDDPYDDAKGWRFLNEIWNSHYYYFCNEKPLPARMRDFWGR